MRSQFVQRLLLGVSVFTFGLISACARVGTPSATALMAEKMRLQNAERKVASTPRGKEVLKASRDAQVELATKDVNVAAEGKSATTQGQFTTIEKSGEKTTGFYTAQWSKHGSDWRLDDLQVIDGAAQVPPATNADTPVAN